MARVPEQLDIELRSIGIGDAIVVTFSPERPQRKVWFEMTVRLPFITRRGLNLPIEQLKKLNISEDGVLRAPRASPELGPDGKWVLILPLLLGLVDPYGRFEIKVYVHGRTGFFGKGEQLAAAAVSRQQERPRSFGPTGCIRGPMPGPGGPMGPRPDLPPNRKEMLKYAREELGDAAVDEFLKARDRKKALRQKLVTESPERVLIWTVLDGVLSHKKRRRKRRREEGARFVAWLLTYLMSVLAAYMVFEVVRHHAPEWLARLTALFVVLVNPAVRRKKRDKFPMQRALRVASLYLAVAVLCSLVTPTPTPVAVPRTTTPQPVFVGPEPEVPEPAPEPAPKSLPRPPEPAPEPPPAIEIIRVDQPATVRRIDRAHPDRCRRVREPVSGRRRRGRVRRGSARCRR